MGLCQLQERCSSSGWFLGMDCKRAGGDHVPTINEQRTFSSRVLESGSHILPRFFRVMWVPSGCFAQESPGTLEPATPRLSEQHWWLSSSGGSWLCQGWRLMAWRLMSQEVPHSATNFVERPKNVHQPGFPLQHNMGMYGMDQNETIRNWTAGSCLRFNLQRLVTTLLTHTHIQLAHQPAMGQHQSVCCQEEQARLRTRWGGFPPKMRGHS